MVNWCVNSACRAEFKFLQSGDFYALERPDASPEFFWLCPECASQFELHLDAQGCVSPRLRGERGRVYAPPSDVHLRLVAHAVQRVKTVPASECIEGQYSVPLPSHPCLRLHRF